VWTWYATIENRLRKLAQALAASTRGFILASVSTHVLTGGHLCTGYCVQIEEVQRFNKELTKHSQWLEEEQLRIKARGLTHT
jgi:hypothetical protein